MSSHEGREIRSQAQQSTDPTNHYKGIGISALAAATTYCKQTTAEQPKTQHTTKRSYDLEVTD